MTEIELTEHREQDTAVVHDRIPIYEVKGFVDRALHSVMAALAAQGSEPTGPPFTKYFGMPGETVELEVGFPVMHPVTPTDGVIAGMLPGGPAVRAVHAGPYDQLGQTYDRVLGWMKREGVEPGDAMWEIYLTDPSSQPDPATWRTEIWLPVA